METTFIVGDRNKISYLVGLPEAKSWLRCNNNFDDNLIESLAKAAEIMFEDYTNRIVSPTRLTVAFQKAKEITLPFIPVVDVLNVVDSSGTAIADYDFILAESKVIIRDNEILYNDLINGIGIEYTAKSDNDTTDAIKIIILEIIARLYENRGDGGGIDISTIKGIGKYSLKTWI